MLVCRRRQKGGKGLEEGSIPFYSKPFLLFSFFLSVFFFSSVSIAPKQISAVFLKITISLLHGYREREREVWVCVVNQFLRTCVCVWETESMYLYLYLTERRESALVSSHNG